MIAILGAGGQLGTAFAERLGASAIPLTRDDLDVSDFHSVHSWVGRQRPDAIINCAGYTAVDLAESDPDGARLVNSTAVGRLAEVAAEIGSRLITFSTDYVFDGAKPAPYLESDETNPLSVYGTTKAEGEMLALAANPSVLVVRTSWLISSTHRNFASTVIEKASKASMEVVDDQIGHPTLVTDLVRASLACLAAGAAGIVHLTNQGVTSWFGLAREIAEIAGLPVENVIPCRASDLGRAAARPANSVLESERLDDFGVDVLPPYRTSLADTVLKLAGNQSR